MFKKIVRFTVVVLFTSLLSGRNTNTLMHASASQAKFSTKTQSVVRISEKNMVDELFANSYTQIFTPLFLSNNLEVEDLFSSVSEPRISDYDELIKRVSMELGHDWRFISAIAYHESRFNPNAISRVGATGLMQIMPIVAREFNVDFEEVVKPEINVTLGVKLLAKLEKMLKLPASTSSKDKTSIILACYNGGYGHVQDARRLARKYGANPNSWDDVAVYLTKKASPEYHEDEVVWYGSFSGSNETLNFVDRVLSRYDDYCQL
ncbi:MAG: transglycosylase SLT domain-containing protein [Rikenellaceae bacterium]